ncbi:MAG TPA: glycosyltransferase family 9 protein [Elusimicrobiota bacterium]|jgi:lipopolysaccharide heptosyltransferase II|nr:glycosyltransferase family 9 protein [Elusimicrobiota bacterium]
MNAWSRAREVLCVRLDSIGDVLMTTPAIRALKRAVPRRRITLLTSPAGAAAAAHVREIDRVWPYAAPWMKPGERASSPAQDRAFLARLRAAGFDAAAIFTVYTQSPLPAALACHLSSIPLRLAHCRENPYGLLTDWVPDPEPQRLVRHEVRRQLDLVSAVGAGPEDEALSLRVPAPAQRRVARILAEAGLADRKPWVLVHPGASAPSRRYPAEAFAAAAAELSRRLGVGLVFSGSGEERTAVDSILERVPRGRAPVVSLAGKLDFAGLAALVSRASVLVSNNTGPAHIAAAVGTPVVVLYALTNPQHAPWGVASRVLYHDVPCRFCYKSVCPQKHHDCLRLVEPSAVFEATRQLLEEVRRCESRS